MKYSVYLEVGNMKDINDMSIDEFNHLYEFIDRREKIRKHQPIPLRDSNKRMIDAYKKKHMEIN